MAPAPATCHLNGGTLSTDVVHRYNSTGQGYLYFNGGTLKVKSNNYSAGDWVENLTHAYVQAGGATIDTNGYDKTVSSPLENDPSSPGGGLTKTGNGVLTLSGANTYSGPTIVQAGVLELGPAAQNPLFSGGGADIHGGKLVLDYTGACADVLTPLTASYHASPSWSVGHIRDTTADLTGFVLGWGNNTATNQLTIMATLWGDTDLNGAVTGDDLATLLTKYNTPGDWSLGDFNYDGSITGADLSLLLSKYNQSIPTPAAGAAVAGVPEPTTLTLLATSLIALLAYAGRKALSRRRKGNSSPRMKSGSVRAELVDGDLLVRLARLEQRRGVCGWLGESG